MQSKKPFTYEEFKAIFSKIPRVTVDLIIVSAKGVLLTLRKDHGYENQWHLPGGTVYYREPLEQAVHRIAAEEVNLKIEIIKPLSYLEYFSEEKERGFGYSVANLFLCRVISGDLKGNEVGETPEYFDAIPENTVLEQKQFLQKNLHTFL